MKIAVFSDIHDNLARWQEAAGVIKKEKIKIGICCGDATSPESLEEIAKSFEKLYLAFGNADYKLQRATGLIPENVEYFEEVGEVEIEKKKIAFVHFDWIARELVKQNKYDIVFYGHTHTPWESTKSKTILLNPGEISGQFGPASFAIYNLTKMNAKLILLK